MEVDTDRHQHGGASKGPGDRVAEERERQGGADEGSGREVGAGPRGAEVAQAKHEGDQTHAVTNEAACRGSTQSSGSGERSAMRKCQQEITRARHQSLDHRNLYRVYGAELAGK